MKNIPQVIDLRVLDNWRMRVTFKDQGVAIVDLTPHLEFGVFRKLKDISLFQQAKISFGTVEWPGGIDLDPEWLLKNGIAVNQVAETGEKYEA